MSGSYCHYYSGHYSREDCSNDSSYGKSYADTCDVFSHVRFAMSGNDFFKNRAHFAHRVVIPRITSNTRVGWTRMQPAIYDVIEVFLNITYCTVVGRKLTLLRNAAKKYRLFRKMFQIKVVRISISYKKLLRRVCLSL